MKKLIAIIMVFTMLTCSIYADSNDGYYSRQKSNILVKMGSAALGGILGYGTISLSGLTAVGAMGGGAGYGAAAGPVGAVAGAVVGLAAYGLFK